MGRFTPHAEPCPAEQERDTRQLVLEAQAENPIAFGELYARCAGRIHRYITVMLRDPTEAEDIVQLTFTRAFEALPRFQMRDEAHFYGWLFRIARNAALNHRRKHRRLDVSEEPGLGDRWELPDGSSTTSAGGGWIEDLGLMERFERLPTLQRQVLVLRFLLDMETEAIATTLRITPTNVRTVQSRAITALRVSASPREPAGVSASRPEPAGVSASRREPAGTALAGLRR